MSTLPGSRIGIAVLLAGILCVTAPPAPAFADASAPGVEPTLVAQTATEDDVNDPLEPINRYIFTFNEFIYDYLLRPAARFYNDTVPSGVREAIHNFLENLKSPVTFANDLLQFEGHRAFVTASRAVINTTLGVGGFFDFAKDQGFERHKEDFGQTLGVWGWGEGPYLVLPVLGPSNPRDAVGRYVVDGFFDPLNIWLNNIDKEEWIYVRSAVNGFDEFARITDELDQIKKTSIDYYAAIRSLYRQKRRTEISNGKEIQLPPIPDLGYDLEQPKAAPALSGTPPAPARPAASVPQQTSSVDGPILVEMSMRPGGAVIAEQASLPEASPDNPSLPYFLPATAQ